MPEADPQEKARDQRKESDGGANWPHLKRKEPDWQILYQLWLFGSYSLPAKSPLALARLESSTNLFMGLLLLVPVVSALFISILWAHTLIAIFVTVCLVEVYKSRFPSCIWLGGFIGDRSVHSRVSESDFASELDRHLSGIHESNWARRLLYSLWKRLQYVAPFSFHNIWWWTLVIGVLSSLGTITSEDSLLELDPAGWNELALGLSTTLVIATLTYIATNLISNLFLIEYRFLDARDETKKLVSDLEDKGESIRRATTSLERNARSAVSVLAAGKELIELDQSFKNDSEYRRETAQGFINEIACTVKNFSVQAKSSQEGSRVFMMLALTEYMRKQSALFNTRQRYLLTSFSHLAKIVSSFAEAAQKCAWSEAQGGNPEFYALLVLPPERFLNYSEEIRGQRTLGDSDWEYYLALNRTLALKPDSVKQVRHFLVLNEGPQDEAASAVARQLGLYEELRYLFSGTVRKELDSWIQVNEDEVPVVVNADGDVVGGSGDQLTSDDERSGFRYNILSTADRPDTGSWIKLRDVLGRVYHKDGRCCVQEYDLAQYMKNHVDDVTKKPIDYFAIRRDNEWVLCLRTLYDKTFDVAKIEVVRVSEGGPRAAVVETELNSIFLRSTKSIADW